MHATGPDEQAAYDARVEREVLDAAARIEIGTWPTPVVKLERVSETLDLEVWAKLEDSCGAWGGNKVRKLEYILGRAARDRVRKLVTFGAGSSNWTSALAYHSTALGFSVEVHLAANEVPRDYERLYRDCGATVLARGRVPWYLAMNQARVWPNRGRTRYLPIGGSGGDGDLGSFRAGSEIAAAVDSGEVPRPRRIFAAAGTGGTAAGVAVGAASAGLACEVVCVRVTPRPYGTARRVRRIARSLQTRLSLAPALCCRLAEDDSFFAPGYAQPNPAALEAAQIARIDGISLDQTYAAKAFAALVAAARARQPGPFLFLHTSPGEPPAECPRRP